MRHYKLVKRSVFGVIAISAFAVFFNTLLLASVGMGLVTISQPIVVKAACDANTAPAAAAISPDTVGKKLTFSFTKSDISNKIGYKIEIFKKVTDIATGAEAVTIVGSPLYGESEPGFATRFIPDPVDIPILSSGNYKVIISYENLTDSSCVYNDQTKQIQEFVFNDDGLVTHGSIELTADPTTINFKMPDGTDNPSPSTTIKFKFIGHENETWSLWITDCSGAFKEIHTNQHILIDPYPSDGSYVSEEWSALDDKSCTYHNARIKTFNDAGNMTGKEELTINISGSGGQIPGSEAVNPPDKLTTPNTIDKVWKFSSAFKLPNQISGVGDLITVIIKVLEYLIGALAVIGLLIGGIQYITSGGDSAKAEKAKKTIIYSIIGIVIAVLSLTIEAIVAGFWKGPS